MDEAASIDVEVVYALANSCASIKVSLSPGATVADAIARSGIVALHPEIDPGLRAVGIFGRCVSLSTQPAAGDRIEIYRPLTADPKQSRRARLPVEPGK